jgi:hypothetical protein
MCRGWGRGETCTGFWWRNLKESNYWENPRVDVIIILRWIFRRWGVVVWTGLSWLRIETGMNAVMNLRVT